MAERQVRVAVVIDDSAAVAGAAGASKAVISMGDEIVSTNTRIAASDEDAATVAKKTADQRIAAILRVREAQKLQIANLSETVLGGLPAGGIGPITEKAAIAQGLIAKENAKLARSYGDVRQESSKLNRSYRETTVATTGFSRATKEGEKDLNKLVRGGLAGSGALSALGRSLAFASTGFIAFAAGATVIKSSIKAAQDEEVAQKQVARQLKTSGKSWQQYGGEIDKVLLKESHLAGFTKAELLQAFGYLVRVGGNIKKSLNLTALAADISRARNISLASSSIALAKALGGSATALRRLGIIVPKNVSTTQALAFVTQKFAGQAAAGTTASEKFHATLVDTGAVIGKALLPTFNRLATSLANWLSKMNESGRLQKDMNTIVSDAGTAFHDLGAVIKAVDKITGSFKNTLEILLAFKLVSIVTGTWVPALVGLAAKWGLVATAAETAGAAQTAVLAESAAGAAGAAGGAAVVGGEAGAGGLALAGAGGPATLIAGGAALFTVATAQALTSNTGPSKTVTSQPKSVLIQGLGVFQKIDGRWFRIAGRATQPATPDQAAAAEALLRGGAVPGNVVRGQPGVSGRGFAPTLPATPQKPSAPTVFKSFTDTIGNQLAQARAALTKGTGDDVAAAKAEIALIKREIAKGHLAGASLVQALQAEAGAVSTIQSAQAAAVQAQTAKIQAQIDPLRLEVQLSRAQALGQSTLPALRALRAAAQRVIASGNATLAQQKQAYDQIASLNDQIKQTTAQGLKTFIEPIKLQIALAREQAFGKSTHATLEAMKRAALKALRSGKYTGQALIDLYNQIASINQQLQSSATAGLGKFKQLNLDKLTAGLGLTRAQRKALQAKLSQVGPGNTVPGSGGGAYGYAIGRDNRPVHVHTHISIDGKKVADNTTRHQHRRRRRNSSQRRGPNAGETG